jgi:hypothetical protein
MAGAAEGGHLPAGGGVGTTLPFFKNQQICATIYNPAFAIWISFRNRLKRIVEMWITKTKDLRLTRKARRCSL